jgi:hypothetical protein
LGSYGFVKKPSAPERIALTTDWTFQCCRRSPKVHHLIITC